MPTYTYRCKKCSHEHTEFHSMSAAPQIRCDLCNGLCEKQIGSGAGIIFKGTGFYETDYKKKSGAPEGGAAGRIAEKTAGKTAESSAEKTPAKSETPKKESKGGKTAGSGKD
mgnify:CR=1 FL=1